MRFYSLLFAISLLSGSVASAAAVAVKRECASEETLSLDELYDLAIAEGGQLVVKAGGDEKDQQASTVQAFQEKFPKINITLTVDLSKVTFSCSYPRLWIDGTCIAFESTTTVSSTDR